MTATQRANIGRGVREATRRKRLSIAMKASWARRRDSTLAVDAADEPSLYSLYEAAKVLTEDFEQLKVDVVNEFSIDELIGGLITYTGGGTNVQKNLRKFLITQIETSLA